MDFEKRVNLRPPERTDSIALQATLGRIVRYLYGIVASKARVAKVLCRLRHGPEESFEAEIRKRVRADEFADILHSI
jgi:hypothetical protein